MSGPYCETCKYFYRTPLSGGAGECTDRTKEIYDRNGNSWSGLPSTHEKYSCANHKPKNEN